MTTIIDGKPHIRQPFGLASGLEIRHIDGKGRGVFTSKDIPAGSIIFIDQPVFTFPEVRQYLLKL